MILARTSVRGWRRSFGGSEDVGAMLAPHPTRVENFWQWSASTISFWMVLLIGITAGSGQGTLSPKAD